MTTKQKLLKIKEKCEELLELASTRTPGKWVLDEEPDSECTVTLSVGDTCYSMEFFLHNDVWFISACAGAAEAGWKSTIAAINECIADKEDYQTLFELANTAVIAGILSAWEWLFTKEEQV